MSTPLIGLCDSNSIYQRTKESDGYGGMKITQTLLVSGWRCRKTIPRGNEELANLMQGKDVEKQWTFLGEVNPLIAEGMYIQEADGTNYEILKLRQQRDAFGNVHHYKIFAEKI